MNITAALKHVSHALHFRSIEFRDIKLCELWAKTEHVSHIYHLIGVKVFNADDAFELIELIEPIITACGTRIGKRGVKNDLSYLSFVFSPCRYGFVLV